MQTLLTHMHVQTEKQRIIWAYKILFLDVLFPLNLKKASSVSRPCRSVQHANRCMRMHLCDNLDDTSSIGSRQCASCCVSLQVIFLDADQVIRTDIKQLADLDLQVSRV